MWVTHTMSSRDVAVALSCGMIARQYAAAGPPSINMVLRWPPPRQVIKHASPWWASKNAKVSMMRSQRLDRAQDVDQPMTLECLFTGEVCSGGAEDLFDALGSADKFAVPCHEHSCRAADVRGCLACAVHSHDLVIRYRAIDVLAGRD